MVNPLAGLLSGVSTADLLATFNPDFSAVFSPDPGLATDPCDPTRTTTATKTTTVNPRIKGDDNGYSDFLIGTIVQGLLATRSSSYVSKRVTRKR